MKTDIFSHAKRMLTLCHHLCQYKVIALNFLLFSDVHLVQLDNSTCVRSTVCKFI